MALCLAVSIPGMIVNSIGDHPGAAITFGLVGAVASLCLIAVTAVVVDPSPMQALGAAGAPSGRAAGTSTAPPPPPADVEAMGAELERRIERLVAQGASEAEVRQAVGLAVRLGRSR